MALNRVTPVGDTQDPHATPGSWFGRLRLLRWAREHWLLPILLLAAAVLLPGRMWLKGRWWTLLLPLIALLCWAAATRLGSVGLDRSQAWPWSSMACVGAAGVLALLLQGRRWAFTAALACLMAALGGLLSFSLPPHAARPNTIASAAQR